MGGMDRAAAYLPPDRRWALARAEALPDRAAGAVLFADISGFTPLTEALVQAFGPRRGAEETTRILNLVYAALTGELARRGGSVVSFSGDALTCWFDAAPGPDGETPPAAIAAVALRAAAAALALQAAMGSFAAVPVGAASPVALALKATVATGAARRFVVGDPAIQLIDVLAGQAVDKAARLESASAPGDVLVDPLTATCVAATATRIGTRAVGSAQGVLLGGLTPAGRAAALSPLPPWAGAPAPPLAQEQVRPWLLPAVYARLAAGQEGFLAELRPAAALFLRFSGIDYEAADAAARLDGYVRWVQAVLARYDGALIQLTTGDKGSYLYAAFGAPTAHADERERALAAALELAAPPAELPLVPQAQIAVTYGRMRAGAYGGPQRQTYGVQGPAVNLAARLMFQAEPGAVVADSRAAAAAGAGVRLTPLPPVRLKGHAQPVALFAVQPGAAPRATATRLPVGRDAELAALAGELASAARGQPRIVLLEGEPGLGKSHLAAHFAGQATAQGWHVAQAACQRATRGFGFWAARQIARQVLNFPATPETSAQEIAWLAEILAARNPAWLLRMPLLGDLLGLPIPDNEATAAFDPPLRRAALLSLLVDLTLAAAAERPLALVVEDAHWLDEPSLAIAVAVAEAAAQSSGRLFLLFVRRPPGMDDRAGSAGDPLGEALAGLAAMRRMALPPLLPAAGAALAGQRLGAPLSPLAQAVVTTQAQGNPLYIEEVADALVEAGSLALGTADGEVWDLAPHALAALQAARALRRTQGAWQLAPDAALAAALGLPDTIQGIVLARFDRLDEQAKLTIKTASVIGHTFDLSLLARCHPAQPDAAQLARDFQLLEARDFTRLESHAPRPLYTFRHNLTQEAIYTTLLEAQRRELHWTVAQALEERAPDAVEQLAFHAGRSDLSRPEPRAAALRYLAAAGARARRDDANDTALSYFTAALELEPRWSWRKEQAELLHLLGRREEEAAALAALDADPAAPLLARALLRAQYAEALDRYAEATAALAEAQQAAQASGDRQGAVRVMLAHGEIARRRGDWPAAAERYRAALEAAAALDDAGPARADALYGLGVTARNQGDYPAAAALLNEALALARAGRRRQAEADALTQLGALAFLQHDYAAAGARYAEALELRRAIGDRAGEGSGLVTLAQAVRGEGDLGQAAVYCRQALALLRAVHSRWWELIVWNELGIISFLCGRYADAQEAYARTEMLSREIGDESGVAYAVANLAQTAREQGDYAAALVQLDRAAAAACSQQDRYLEATCASERGVTLLRAGDPAGAADAAHGALALWAEMELPLATTGDHAVLAAAALAQGDAAAAAAHADAALVLLDGCAGQGPDYPQRDYWMCAAVLAALNRPADADRARATARALLHAQAAKISDDDLRRSYLENVWYNREIGGQPTAGR